MKLFKQMKNEQGFSLLEVMVMIALIGVFSVPIIIMLIQSIQLNAKNKEKQYISTYMDEVVASIESGDYNSWLSKCLDDNSLGDFLDWKLDDEDSINDNCTIFQADTTSYNNQDVYFLGEKGTELEDYSMEIKSENLRPDENTLGSYTAFGYNNHYVLTFKSGEITCSKVSNGKEDSTFGTKSLVSNVGVYKNGDTISMIFNDEGCKICVNGISSELKLNSPCNDEIGKSLSYFGFEPNEKDVDSVTRSIRIIDNVGLNFDFYNISKKTFDKSSSEIENYFTNLISIFYEKKDNTEYCIKYDNNIEIHDISDVVENDVSGSPVLTLAREYKEILYTVTIYDTEGEELLTESINKMYVIS